MPAFRFPKAVLLLACLFLALFSARAGSAAELSPKDARSVLEEAFIIAGYTGLHGESEFAGKPQNVIRAALFGAFDAKMRYVFEQDRLEEEGKPPLPASHPLFVVNGRALMPDQVKDRDEAPDLFTGLPEQYNVFISREAVELAALRYTGHSVAKHEAPGGEGFLGDTLLNDKGYFVSIDGLGDLIIEPELKSVTPRGEGFVLAGALLEPDESAKPGAFALELMPGDVAGTWKRQYTETPAK